MTPLDHAYLALAESFLHLARVAVTAWVLIEAADLVVTHWRRGK
jgi:hypothetical protein